MAELWTLSAAQLHDLFAAGEVTAEAIVEAHLERIQAVDGSVRAFLYVDADGARETARAQDRWTPKERQEHPLSGVPVALKDNIVTRTMPTTAGSKILGRFISPYDATVVDKLHAAGAIVIGKTNLDEFAMGSSTEHSAFGSTFNPWDLTRVPGGSSGGSAAAVAARMVPVALGSDTGGSIRQPASYTGVVGFKPTYGRVSRYGLIAFASSLDQIGPMTRSVGDARRVFEAIQGYDRQDSTSLQSGAWAPEGTSGPWRIGIPKEYFGEGLDPVVRQLVEAHLEGLAQQGHQLVEISLPHSVYAIAAYYLIAPAEASSNLSRYDGVRYGMRASGHDLLSMYETTRDEGFGDEVKRRVLLGTHALSAGYYDQYYLTAQKVRTRIREDFERAFSIVDYIVTPTTPDRAFRLGEKSDDLIRMYLGDIYTVTANLAGIPGISIPLGLGEGLPVGVQWLAPTLADEALLGAVRAVESICQPMPWPEEVQQ
ncbi:Asp-tRNA(Asn)/Glu-tRNA(Gln) amidotransferase subunit GatA [Sulfobacillus harzensis]|uniref:Glutamyl-tRNA(Gln) amidotransferase subunit A n=1 Tax=Sulfobacillus harzensis TaxID=2729629 RepID=A0A7Y0L3F6_9FIRM|nr:Asp-tRNA(Asn)/Glu-tRNA(Gln) amidotransferase subunit GatA [Sulfobacillus harzensis]NMP22581.1 Asp-tRNA(Asn)/Glu-tRNA(Gln) amidotransferase subunit GatA [Sulfobacillus harzensis]